MVALISLFIFYRICVPIHHQVCSSQLSEWVRARGRKNVNVRREIKISIEGERQRERQKGWETEREKERNRMNGLLKEGEREREIGIVYQLFCIPKPKEI